MGNTLIPIFWKDLTLEAQSKVEKYVKSGSVNVATWTKHYRDGKFPLCYITVKKEEQYGTHN